MDERPFEREIRGRGGHHGHRQHHHDGADSAEPEAADGDRDHGQVPQIQAEAHDPDEAQHAALEDAAHETDAVQLRHDEHGPEHAEQHDLAVERIAGHLGRGEPRPLARNGRDHARERREREGLADDRQPTTATPGRRRTSAAWTHAATDPQRNTGRYGSSATASSAGAGHLDEITATVAVAAARTATRLPRSPTTMAATTKGRTR